jgi:chloride channel protein, CIC family
VPLLARHFQRLPKQTRAIVATCLFGLVAGGAAVAFHYGIHALYHGTLVAFSRESTGAFLLKSFLTVIGSSLLVGWLLTRFCRAAAGSGIPQLKLAYWKEFGVVPWRVVWVKFIAGVLSIGGGSSLGREGPSVQLAGGAASNLAGVLGEAKQKRRLAAASGAAAGMAAAFNTPVAAVTFVLEEIVQDLNSRYLGGILLASVIGALVAHGLIGKQPAFLLASLDSTGWIAYALTPLVAAVAACIGMYFQTCALAVRNRQKSLTRIPDWGRPAIGGLITWVIGCGVFLLTGSLGVFGLGYEELSRALTGHYDWALAGVLLASKLVATIACYGFGGCGGIFSPTLFFGGMSGIALSGLLGLIFPLQPSDHILLAVVGMSACMGAVVRAPVTSILIVFEMTHEFALVPALMIGTLVSQAISRKLAKKNFYEALLQQDGHELLHVIPPRDLQSWQQLPVSAIANFSPVLLKDLSRETVEASLKQHPYLAFPVILDKQLAGLLPRAEAERALRENREPKLEAAVTCRPHQSIRELQMLLIESTTGVVVLTDRPGGRVLGLVTLHDLFRAEVSIAERGE